MRNVINFSDYCASKVKSENKSNIKPKLNPINNTEIRSKRIYTEDEYDTKTTVITDYHSLSQIVEDYNRAIQIQRKLAYNIVLLLKLNETMPVEEAIQAIIQKAGE